MERMMCLINLETSEEFLDKRTLIEKGDYVKERIHKDRRRSAVLKECCKTDQ
ncbi:hypothetical protein [Peribacillus deserti]|uniref:hypothetical protein n=1 Tax=Peribacillus deserti TaxID=673318 RepID=UPI0015E0BC68|nr:hypothetical protein [Peribacillus deserti]